jgi:hypothetical protein
MLTGISSAMAGAVPSTCDPQVQSVIDARAWMGGKRDMESATSLIVRNANDSILDMSCFDRHIEEFAQQNNYLFSDGHTRYVSTGAPAGTLFRQEPLCFGDGCTCYQALTQCSSQEPEDHFQPTFMPALGPNPPGAAYTNVSLDNSFINLVRISLRNHLSPNFRTGTPATGICSSMNNLWQAAKCTDINKSGWITLSDHRNNDRRPATYGACNDRSKWSTQFTNANPAPGAAGALDSVVTYRGTIYPTNCSAIRPVRTGLTMKDGNNFRADAVCPGVGCYYNRAANTCN